MKVPGAHDDAEDRSPWNHAICCRCWEETRGARVPFRVEEAPEVRCCYCRDVTTSGIWVRGDPHEMPCAGGRL